MWLPTALAMNSLLMPGLCEKGRNVEYIVKRYKKCLEVGLEWGPVTGYLKYIHSNLFLIRSWLDYGRILFRSAAKSMLANLAIIQSQAQRV